MFYFTLCLPNKWSNVHVHVCVSVYGKLKLNLYKKWYDMNKLLV